ncbi:hypothetical protein P8A22_19710 [Streptomyces laculatispora]|uniref:Uncharacterized protein n=1 Tax=Streptomyces laculatispora TaxID=887464 RepID=A0ABY9I5S9_9ACTN|nr:hypothetical protein [Streptomyces laculatispora]WLQ41994.1 hypothetical protein P8A22_19710 [Streptomyces laculatispora]
MRNAYVIGAESADEFGVWDMAPVRDRASEDLSVWDRAPVWDMAPVWDRASEDLSVWDRTPVWDRAQELQAA